jgi:transcriptional regulator with XRE-family HTH domain
VPKIARKRRRGAPDHTPDELAQLQRLAERVIDARGAAGVTQEDLAAAAGVSSRYIQKLESGAFNPSYVKMIAVARALGRHGRMLLTLD